MSRMPRVRQWRPTIRECTCARPCYSAAVQRTRATYTLDNSVLRAARIAAARQGKRESEIVEEALRRYLGLGVLEEIWAESPRDLDADAALALAVSEQHAEPNGE
jgi:hypothetical protein